MPNLWIVHRDPAARRTLARLAGARGDVVVGAPGDRGFESASEPDVILLGAAGDFEAELEFAHRYSERRPGASWILLPEAGSGEDARQLFDALAAEILPFPPDPMRLRRRIRAAAAGRRRHDSLSERRVRDALADRFRRWFSDLELPELLRAVDPHLATVPVLIRGEPGTGRTVIAQYIHIFGGSTGGVFVHVPCRGIEGPARAVLDLIGAATSGGDALTICLEDVDALSPVAQRQLRIWIENGLPPGTVRADRVRWIATAGEENPWSGENSLDATLEDALAGIVIRIPPLRNRMEALDAMVASAAASWCQRHGQRMRTFTPEAMATLREVLWLGNVREVEATVSRTLASHAEDPVQEASLELEGTEPHVNERVAADFDARYVSEPELAEATGGLEIQEVGGEPRDRTATGADPSPRSSEPSAPAAASPGQAEGSEAPPDPADDGVERLRELVGSIAHEIRNPLVAVQTFAQLLPERFDDPEFRRKAADIVGADVRRIESVVERLSRLAELGAPEPKAVDVASLLETALEAQREIIQRRRLVVLTELDRTAPHALGDADQLRFAFESLLDKALELVPDRGDLYFASRHHGDGLDGEPALRVLVRFRSPGDLAATSEVPGVSLGESSLEMTVARSIIKAHGGRMTVSPGDARETVVVIDLPAPG